MNIKSPAKRRLTWTVILVVLVLGLLFIPGIRKRVLRTTPAGTGASQGSSGPSDRNTQTSTGALALNPALSQAPLTIPHEDRATLFKVVDARTGSGIEGAALHLGPLSERGVASLESELLTDKNGHCEISLTLPMAVTVRAAGYVSHVARFRDTDPYPVEYTFKL